MGKTAVSGGKGIVVDHEGTRFALDPHGQVDADYTFVSHAHMDHMDARPTAAKVLASEETWMLARARGVELGRGRQATPRGVKLLDSGHILGSRALLIEDELLYTGDAAGRERAFLGACKTRKAKVLITETTFGRKRYQFPVLDETVKRVNEMVSRAFDKGRPVVLMGYPLGKSQVLSYLFSCWTPLYLHESVASMNEIYRSSGVELKDGSVIDRTLEGLPQGPWLMVAPIMGPRNKVVTRLRKEFGAMTAVFSGWAMDPGYAYSLGADSAFPISDHCDYSELMRLVRSVSPETVYTTHGFASEFASDLRKEGFDARPLGGYQSSLADY